MVLWIVASSVFGFLVSAYGVRVETKVTQDPDYRPLCDVRGKIMCSGTLTSKYSHILGISNAKLGMLFYPLLAVLAFLGQDALVFWLVIVAAAGSLVLAYLLFTRVQEICLVCSSIYAINLVLLLLVL